MSKIKKIRLKEIKGFLKRLPIILGKNAFFTFLGLFVLSLILAFFVFQKYYLSITKVEPETTEEQFKFHSETYQEVIDVWQEKEERLKKTEVKQYPNPFLP